MGEGGVGERREKEEVGVEKEEREKESDSSLSRRLAARAMGAERSNRSAAFLPMAARIRPSNRSGFRSR